MKVQTCERLTLDASLFLSAGVLLVVLDTWWTTLMGVFLLTLVPTFIVRAVRSPTRKPARARTWL